MAENSNSMEDAILSLVQGQLSDVNTAMPGVIVSYADGYAKVMPIGKKRFADGDELDFPAIPNVPVCWPSFAGGTAGLKGPINAGDKCLIVFAQQATDGSDDLRQFDMTDAYAVMCDPANTGGGNDALTLFFGGASVSINASGAVTIEAPGGLTINGKVVQSGGTMTSEGVVVSTHVHKGVTAGGGMSGPPNS